MSELSPRARALVEAGRGFRATPRDRARVHAALHLQLVAVPVFSAPGASLPQGFVKGLLLGLGAPSLLAAVAIGGAWLLIRPAPLPPAPEQRVVLETALEPAEVEALPQPAELPLAPQPQPARHPKRVESSPRVQAPETVEPPAPATPEPITTAAPAPPTRTLEQELELLRAAQAALSKGDGVSALKAVDEHRTRFAGGTLEAERDAAEVFALCLLGRRNEATERGHRFLESHSTSPLAARVRASCVKP